MLAQHLFECKDFLDRGIISLLKYLTQSLYINLCLAKPVGCTRWNTAEKLELYTLYSRIV